MVAGAFGDRGATAPLSAALAAHLTVLTLDRRGRGDSDDTAPYGRRAEQHDLVERGVEAG
jgi:hypothetical protein